MSLQGVKGLLEAAGYTVYNPTLPYHFPNDTWNLSDGLVTIQQYIDVYKGVSVPARSDCSSQLFIDFCQESSAPPQAALRAPSVECISNSADMWLAPIGKLSEVWDSLGQSDLL